VRLVKIAHYPMGKGKGERPDYGNSKVAVVDRNQAQRLHLGLMMGVGTPEETAKRGLERRPSALTQRSANKILPDRSGPSIGYLPPQDH